MDALTREELDAKLAASEARSDAKFADLRGQVGAGFADMRSDVRELAARSIGKTSFFFGLIALFAAIVAVMALAPAWFGTGFAASDIAERAAAKAIAEQPRH